MIETEVHVIFDCEAARLAQGRELFYAAVSQCSDESRKQRLCESDEQFLTLAIMRKETVGILARWLPEMYRACAEVQAMVRVASENVNGLGIFNVNE